MGPLANLFSTIDSTKRKIGGLLDNPLGTFQQLIGQMQDYRREDARLGDIAYGDPRKGEPLVKNEQAFNQLTQRAFDNLMSFAPAGITVWHGSPHKFDKFDASKIGTGEGAQAYGHGLYLAESPEVAKSYQTALAADRGFSFGGKSGLTRSEVQDMVNAKYGAGYLDGVLRPSGVADSFIDDMVTGLNRAEGSYPRQYKPGSQRAKVYDELRGQISHADPGSLYKVDLPDEHIAKMLDWDKPLSQQPKNVQEALNGVDLSQVNKRIAKLVQNGEADGQTIYKAFGSWDNPSGAANALRQAGIPGIRYLDGGSRGTGQGTSNFVVFPGNEGLLSILERNGQPLR